MSTSAVVLFALVALSLTPAADANCSGTKRNANTFCAAATCTEAECCEYAPNTCAKYNGQTVGTNVYACPAVTHTYDTTKNAEVIALGTTVANFQTACCKAVVSTAGTCAVYTCSANHHANTAAATTTGATDAICCTENPKCSAYTCPAGYASNTATAVANGYIGTTTTTTAVTTASTTQCCTLTAGTCAAWFATPNTCSANYHQNTAALGNTGATNTACCTADFKCSDYACPAGYTAANANTVIGSSTTVTGVLTTACCTVTTGTCRGYNSQAAYSCPTGYTFNDATAGSTVAATAICASTFLSTCCTAKPTCASYTCGTSMRVASTSCAMTGGVNTCADAQCCATAYNTCASPATAALTGCSAGTYVSTATAGTSAPCTQTEYQTACCVSYPTCSTYSCPGGYAANTALTSTACALGACSTTQCCTQITGACNLHTCGTGKTLTTATLSTVGNTDAACCTDLPLCSAYTCNAGITTGKTAGATYGASDAACCTADTTKCYGSILGCPNGYYSIRGNAAATNSGLSAVGQDTFNTNCCVMTELCTAYWYATGTSSSAVALRPALATVVIGAIAGLLM